MAVQLTFINLIIPIENIEKCQKIGGFKGFLELHKKEIGKRTLYDDYLLRYSAMSGWDIEFMVKFFEEQGLAPFEGGENPTIWRDLCVYDQYGGGLTLPCDWIEFGAKLEEGEKYKTDYAYLKGKPIGEIVKSNFKS